MAEQITAQGAQQAAGGGKLGRKLLLVSLAVIVLMLALGSAVWFFLLPAQSADTAQSSAEAAEAARSLAPVQYLDLTPSFVVNFPHLGRQRFLQANLTIMSRDAEALQAVTNHMPVVRHNLINLFSAQLLLVFEDPSGLEDLRALATEEVQAILQAEIGRKGIEEVLFTSFVLQ